MNEVLSYFESFPHELDGDVMLYVHPGQLPISDPPELNNYDRCPYCGNDELNVSFDDACIFQGEGGWSYRVYGCGVKLATDGDSVFAVSKPTGVCGFIATSQQEDMI